MRTWGFHFADTPDALVRDGEIRFDAGPPYLGQVTRVYVDNLDRDGQYIRPMLAAYPVGTVLYLEAAGDTFVQVQTLRPPLKHVGYLEFPVVTLAATPAGIPPGPVTVALLPPARAAQDDPLLVTLATAKQHLRVYDTDHDADVTQKMTAASAAIRDYLKERNDPTWDDTTAPPWVVQAVLLLLGNWYEHRGDAFGPANDNDDRVWQAIERVLRRSRDPALA